MYLVHAALRAPAAGRSLPGGLAAQLLSLAGPDQVEHVSVHPDARPDAVVGVFLVADRLADAERRAADLLHRAVEEVPALRGWSVGPVRVPLVGPFYDRLLSGSGPVGRNGPGTVPSN
ncbi:hypothetical protein ACFCX4_12275 [Kitasatospora sp. NPDC056327]|uniref:hypothetical protein n=1 Tax=Kitasatospora sp. NPDC056327 TaxID=3345785 RepID=UPI0035DC704B